MTISGNDTIAAIATPPGDGGIGIVRISGPRSLEVACLIFRGRGGRSLETAAPRLLVLGDLIDPETAEAVDEVLAVSMPAGRSFTGEPSVEIHGHGGRVVLDAVLRAALSAGARLAAPGEFTRRAFLFGRIDLAQAEAVAELIGAESLEEGRLALLQLHGGLGAAVREIRERLLELVAATEAALDFAEDGGPNFEPDPAQLAALAAEMRNLAHLGAERRTAPGAVKVVVAGRPNSGKSCLFNKLLGCERSIVAPVPGTTRDYIEEKSSIDGTSLSLIDTAGIRESHDPIEAEGVSRSRRQIAEADIIVLLIDGSVPAEPEDLQLLQELIDRSPLLVISKSDLPERLDRSQLLRHASGLQHFSLSALTGNGCPRFIEALAARCRDAGRSRAISGRALAPNQRHQEALRRAAGCLDLAAELSAPQRGTLDQAAVEMRSALAAIGEISGETATEEILERIFGGFCIGK